MKLFLKFKTYQKKKNKYDISKSGGFCTTGAMQWLPAKFGDHTFVSHIVPASQFWWRCAGR
jgi:hypothetical protein